MLGQRPTAFLLRLVALLTLVTGLLGAAAADPGAGEAAPASVFGSRRYTVPANGTLSVIVRGFCLDKERHFPGTYLEPSDHRVSDDVLRTFGYTVDHGLSRKQPYQTQLAIWFLRENQWFNTTRPRDLAEDIVRQGRSAPVPERPTDAPTLTEAVQSGAIKASISDFHAITENYEGEGTLVMTNTTDQPVTLYLSVGTVFKAPSDSEQRMLTWAQGGLSGYTRGSVDGNYTLNLRGVESRKFPQVDSVLSVLDSHQMPVRDLTPDRFEVLEDGQPVEGLKVQASAEQGGEPETLSVVVVVDASREAMSGELSSARLAADFIEGLREKDQVLLVEFNGRVQAASQPSPDKPTAVKELNGLQPETGQLYYDALTAAMGRVGTLPAGRKAIVVFAQGGDSGSDPDPGDVIDWAAEQGTPIFTVAAPGADRSVLDPFTQATGGLAFGVSSASEASNAFEAMSSYLREHYRLGFTSALRADGWEHKLAIRIRNDAAVKPAEATFLAYRNPPVVEMISPRDNAQLQDSQPVEFTIKSQATVTEVELTSDGKSLTTLTNETGGPWLWTWDTSTLGGGQHALNVIVRDRAGNQSIKVVPVALPGGKANRPVPDLTIQAPKQRDTSNPWPIVFAVIGLAAVGAGGYFGTRRLVPELKKRRPLQCPIHKITYPRDGACPTCLAEARGQISDRLGQFSRRDAPVEG